MAGSLAVHGFPMTTNRNPTRWQDHLEKFRVALMGLIIAARGHSSVRFHAIAAIAVTAMSLFLRIDLRGCALLATVAGLVMATELLNTAIEELVRVIHPERSPTIGRVLDISAAAVLVAASVAIVVGFCILGPPLIAWWQSAETRL